MYWSPATGAKAVVGAIGARWAAQGWETGPLGYPVSDETCGLRGGGCFQQFQGGSVHFTPATGAQATWGAIRDRWAAQGWETGLLGYPVSGEICGLRGGGCFQQFQGGSVLLVAGHRRAGDVGCDPRPVGGARLGDRAAGLPGVR